MSSAGYCERLSSEAGPGTGPDAAAVLAATASLDHDGVPQGLRRIVREERVRLARYHLALRRDASCSGPITPR